MKSGSALHASTATVHQFLHLAFVCHGSISRGCHGERSVGGTVLHRFLRVTRRHQSIDKTGSKTVAAADAVQDFQIGILAALKKPAPTPGDRRPIVDRCRLCSAERSSSTLEIGERLYHRFDHSFERGDIDVQQVLIRTLHVKSEAGREIFFVADHHVDILRDLLVHLLRAFLAADGFPQTRAIV